MNKTDMTRTAGVRVLDHKSGAVLIEMSVPEFLESINIRKKVSLSGVLDKFNVSCAGDGVKAEKIKAYLN